MMLCFKKLATVNVFDLRVRDKRETIQDEYILLKWNFFKDLYIVVYENYILSKTIKWFFFSIPVPLNFLYRQ